ncbi:efflux RND transporter periplasmic adaptor subunit [Bacteroidota bacterium]
MKWTLPILIISVTLSSCASSEEKPENKERVINVKVAHPERMVIKEAISASGVLDTRQQMKLSFKTGGIIQSVAVREGQNVQSGDVLANLDLSEVNAGVQQAGIAFDKASRDLERAENLFQDSVATLEMLQNARSALEMAVSQKQVAEFNLEHSVIKAPSNGKIQKILAENNEIIGPGYPVLLFASTENEWIVRISLTDKDIVKLRLGDSAFVVMDAFPDRKFPGTVWELGAIADPVTGTYEAALRLDTMLAEFRAGYISHASINTNKRIEGWWLPFEAVLDISDNRAYVFVADSTSARKKVVKTGPLVNEGILILDGLDWEDPVITVGANYLTDGGRIRLVSGENTVQQ